MPSTKDLMTHLLEILHNPFASSEVRCGRASDYIREQLGDEATDKVVAEAEAQAQAQGDGEQAAARQPAPAAAKKRA